MKVSTLLTIATAAAVSAAPLTPRAEVAEPEKFLLKLSDSEERWVTEEEKWELRKDRVNFFDKTWTQTAETKAMAKRQAVTYPTTAKYTSAVNTLIRSLSTSNLQTNLQGLTEFNNRYYRASTGSEAATWLKNRVQSTIDAAGSSGATVEFFTHSWAQSSIIARVPGKSDATVIVGGHFDSINLDNPSSGRAPGADDDGSGSVTNLEILKGYLASAAVRNGEAANTVEFHWYAAEEAGLLGSQAIFDAYARDNRNVVAMLNHDMTGYTAGMTDAGQSKSLAVVTDYVNTALSNFVRLMIRTYTTLPITTSTCGYACSDHASATDAGFPSAYVFESPDAYSSPYIHSASDTISTVDFGHVLNHAKAGLGFVYELAFTTF